MDLASWAIPADVLAVAPEHPWRHPPEDFVVPSSGPVETPSTPVEREVLPIGGTVLDVGCGGGRASLALVPPAARIVGVDESDAMLERFEVAAAERGVEHACHRGRWPEVASDVPDLDVVVCHHVVYNVPDVVSFLEALTAHARLAVVVELTAGHPLTTWSLAWQHFWGIERPSGPTAEDLVGVVRALGWGPEVWRRRPVGHDPLADRERAVRSTRRRLCLSADRDQEVADFLDLHPLVWPRDIVTVRWPGESGGG